MGNTGSYESIPGTDIYKTYCDFELAEIGEYPYRIVKPTVVYSEGIIPRGSSVINIRKNEHGSVICNFDQIKNDVGITEFFEKKGFIDKVENNKQKGMTVFI